VQCLDREGAGFEAEPQALLRSTRLHRQQRVVTPAPRDMESAVPRHPEPPVASPRTVAPPSAPRSHLTTAHLSRVHRAAIALPMN